MQVITTYTTRTAAWAAAMPFEHVREIEPGVWARLSRRPAVKRVCESCGDTAGACAVCCD